MYRCDARQDKNRPVIEAVLVIMFVQISVVAGLLTHRWKKSTWGPAATLLENPADFAATEPRPRPKPRQVQRRFSKTFWDEVVAEYLAGASATSLEKKHNVDDETIRNQLRKRGITPRPQKPPTFVGDNLKTAQAMRANGATFTAIGKHFGVTRYAVSLALKNAERTA